MRKIRNINLQGNCFGYAGPVGNGRGSRKSPDNFAGTSPPRCLATLFLAVTGFLGKHFTKGLAVVLTAAMLAAVVPSCKSPEEPQTENQITIRTGSTPQRVCTKTRGRCTIRKDTTSAAMTKTVTTKQDSVPKVTTVRDITDRVLTPTGSTATDITQRDIMPKGLTAKVITPRVTITKAGTAKVGKQTEHTKTRAKNTTKRVGEKTENGKTRAIIMTTRDLTRTDITATAGTQKTNTRTRKQFMTARAMHATGTTPTAGTDKTNIKSQKQNTTKTVTTAEGTMLTGGTDKIFTNRRERNGITQTLPLHGTKSEFIRFTRTTTFLYVTNITKRSIGC